MPLAPGTRLGPYEVVAPLGAGGMGEVYRAHDSRLGRDVAVKVLPQHLSASPEVRARFEREARTVSGLNHPHICVLHDVGREGDTDFLVMELIDGETLAARLARGPLPPADVLRLGAQIADALDRAHRAGVIHRDLKPGNVMLTKSGAKLMDFGLARGTGIAGGPASGSTLAGMTHSPTVAAPLTAEGTIVGTFQYMAPEQLEGKEADARSDVWALGCVLYEMATGKRAFEGATQASLIGAIMRDAPRPMSELAPMSPLALDRLVAALLAKDPDDRIQTAHDVKLQLQWTVEPGSSSGSQVAALAHSAKRARAGALLLAWSVAGVALALAALAWLLPSGRGAGSVAQRARLLVPEPANARFSGLVSSSVISPDGRTLAFVANDSTGTSRLWLRPLDALVATPVAGSERADQPFWSPDSRALGFFADGKLRRIGIEGGMSDVLCDAPDPRGGAWSSRGTIVFAPSATGGLFQVPADGGTASEIMSPDSARGETALRCPEFLPDGKSFSFVSLPNVPEGYPAHLGRLDSRERRFLMNVGAAPVCAQPGWLLTVVNERLVAQRIDSRSGKLVGKPVTLGEAPLALGHNGTRALSASRNGVMVYSAGRRSNSQLAWLDRNGRVEKMFSLPAGRWEGVNLSPDGSRALVSRRITSSNSEMWLVEIASGQATSVRGLPFGVGAAVWSPDGQRVVFQAMPKGPYDLFLLTVDSGQVEPLYSSPVLFKNPNSWSPDGKHVVFEQPGRETNWDVWMIAVDGDRTPVPLVRTTMSEGGGWISPDGRWMAHYSDESGTFQMYVRPFGRPGPARLVEGTSIGGSAFFNGCWWSADGRELLVMGSDGAVRSSEIQPGETFRAGRARDLFRATEDVIVLYPTADHRRFLATIQVEPPVAPALVVDMNWTAALDKR